MNDPSSLLNSASRSLPFAHAGPQADASREGASQMGGAKKTDYSVAVGLKIGGNSPRSGISVSLAAAASSASNHPLPPTHLSLPITSNPQQVHGVSKDLKASLVSEIEPMVESDEDESASPSSARPSWAVSHPVAIHPPGDGPGGGSASGFGGRTYHVSLLANPPNPAPPPHGHQDGSLRGRTSPLSSSLARVATFVGGSTKLSAYPSVS